MRLLVLWLVLLLVGCADAPDQPVEGGWIFRDAQFLLSDSQLPPPDSAPWQAQSLPDNWSRTRPGVGGSGWYRIAFEVSPGQRRLSALHIPRLSMNGAAFINGEFLGSGGRFDEPIARQWYRPQLYLVPGKMFRPGSNVLHIRIKAYADNGGGLSELQFGPASAIAERWRSRYFWQVITLQMTSALTLGLSALALFAWSLRRWNTAYGYFGAAALLWGVRNLHFLFRDLPMPAAAWEIFVTSSLVWVLVLVFLFVLRFADRHLPVLQRLAVGLALAAPLLLWLAGARHVTLASSICYLLLLVIGAQILIVVFQVVLRERSVSALVLLASTVFVYALGAHDWLVHRGIGGYAEPYKLHFGAPVLFIAVAWNMFRRFYRAQSEAAGFALDLERRVQEKTVELEATHRQLRAIEASRAQAQERARIMQDMHDGLGSQLVSSLAMAQSGQLSASQAYELLRSCIDDLRLAMDASSESSGPFAIALGNLRFRLEPRLAAAGVRVEWSVEDVDAALPLAGDRVLPVLRIIQEAIANTLKHANAKTLRVAVARDDNCLTIDLHDDGQGFDVAQAGLRGRGKGLGSLAKRARLLGAALHIESGSSGTHVRLVLPLEPVASSAG